MNKKIISLLFLFCSILNSASITLYDIQEYKINKEKILYNISANSKKINPKKLKKFKFYNKEKVISKSSYYLNGTLSTKNLKVDFKKGYFLEGNFIMLDLLGTYKKIKIKAKKAVFTKEKLNLKNVFITLKGKKYRKIKYTILLNN